MTNDHHAKVDLVTGAGDRLPGGVRVAGRAARRVDRVAGNPAGCGLPPAHRHEPGDGCLDLLAVPDLALARRLGSGPARVVLGRPGAGRAADRRDSARSLPGAALAVLPVPGRGGPGV